MGKTFHPDGHCVYTGFWWRLALPAVTLSAHLAVSVLASAAAVRFLGGSGATLAIGLPAGFVAWTLFEYVLHRWLLHDTRHPVRRKVFWEKFHREHHLYRKMEDPDPHTVHPAITLPISIALLAAVGLATRSALALIVTTGWLVGYSAYEGLHWVFHSAILSRATAPIAWVRRLRAAHTIHHLERANRNYGFLTLFWDRVFGTFDPVGARQSVKTNSISCSPGGSRTAR